MELKIGDKVIYRRKENLNSQRRGKFYSRVNEQQAEATILEFTAKRVVIEIGEKKVRKAVKPSEITKEK